MHQAPHNIFYEVVMSYRILLSSLLLAVSPAFAEDTNQQPHQEQPNSLTFDNVNEFFQSALSNTSGPIPNRIHYVQPETESPLNPLELTPGGFSRSGGIYKSPETLKLKDFIGSSAVKERVRHVIEMFKHPEKLEMLGGCVKNGLILAGPSGTGKTMLAHAIANELGFSLVKKSGSEFINKYVGVGAANVRSAFEEALEQTPCVLFIDEVDAVATARESSEDSQGGAGSSEKNQTLNELLCQMNSVKGNKDILVIVATNMVESLDPAFRAPHRFDTVIIGTPDRSVRKQLIQHYAGKLPRIIITPETIELMLERTENATGAMIESIFKTAVQMAALDDDATEVTQKHLLAALEQEREALKSGLYGAEKSRSEDTVTFANIIGMDDTVAQFKDIVMLLKNRDRMKQFGVELPSGIMLAGKPGCGKTLLARALANEANCAFFYVSAASLESKWVGGTAKNIRDLFEKAALVSPSIIFMDEFDAIGAQENNPALKELLTQMDGFDQHANVLVIAATNVIDRIIPSVKRNGRFSSIIEVNLPNDDSRRKILTHYVLQKPLVNLEAVPYDMLVKHTKDFSSAGLKELVDDAVLRACVEGSALTEAVHFEAALNKALAEKKFRK